eukprot:GAFH01001372.1.p1 GENE.GAFH01001372.1~~GAFH01001372.1.p1  ORF type:complete len:371 (+),score=53.21 GAFH01001372.1:123-1115(+)
MMRDLGAGFDCASAGEIDLALSLGIQPSSIVFANTLKSPYHIKHAMDVGVHLMASDSLEEMEKIARIYPGAGVLLRIVACDKEGKYQFSSKFGADEDIVEPILRRCLSLPISIEGVSFHLGPGGCNYQTFSEAVRHAIGIVKLARGMGHTQAKILDVGGGMVDNDSINEVARGFADVLAEPGCPPDLVCMSEPGRWFCSGCLTLAAPVIATRFRRGRHSIHIAEGAYGMFSNIVWKKHEIDPAAVVPLGKETAPRLPEPADVWGPSCDSLDWVCKDIALPRMAVGDWLVFPDMGHYSYVAATEFNGFRRGRIVYADDAQAVLRALPRADL